MKGKKWVIWVMTGVGMAMPGSGNSPEAKALLSEPVIIVENDTVTLDELIFNFKKNNTAQAGEKEIMEYVDLFLNYKLKVIAAKEMGLDTTPSFRRERETYRKQVIAAYMEDRELKDYMLREMYQWLQTELKVSHILIRPAGKTKEDSLKAKALVDSIYQRLRAGEKFEDLARRYSHDTFTREKGGSLGWHAANFFTYEIEKLLYSLPRGGFTTPVLTQFGYHIFKVEDKRPYRGRIKVAHILVRVGQNDPPEKVDSARKKILAILDSIKAGKPFEEMARKYSEDRVSALRGGMLDYFSTGTMVPEFEDVAFSLKEKGQVGGPVRTYYGFHLIKLIDREELKPFQDEKGKLMALLLRDPARMRVLNDSYIRKLKGQYIIKMDSQLLAWLSTRMDTSLLFNYESRKILPPKKRLDDIFMSLTDTATGTSSSFTIKEFLEFVVSSVRKDLKKGTASSQSLSPWQYGENYLQLQLKKMEEALLPLKNREVKYLLKEYEEGSLVFAALERKVWDVAISDTAGLMDFYTRNREKYMWPERADAVIFFIDKKECVPIFKKFFEKKRKKINDAGKILDELARKHKCYGSKAEGLYIPRENQYIDSVKWSPGFYGPISVPNNKDRFAFVWIKRLVPPEPRDFIHARGMVLADYQEYLRKKWEEELKKRYKYTINTELIKKYLREAGLQSGNR